MNKLNLFTTVILLAVLSCNNSEQKTKIEDTKPQANPKEEIAKLNDYLKKFDEPSQIFKAPTDKPIKITGKQGTVIHLNPSDLVTESGKPLGKEVEIELKELNNQQQMLRANTQTISDGGILITGGAYYINVTSDGETVKLKEGKSYPVEFIKNSNDDMSLFFGQRDSMGAMNWKPANVKFETPAPIVYHDTNSQKEVEAIFISGNPYHRKTAVLKEVPQNISDSEYQKNVEKIEADNKQWTKDKEIENKIKEDEKLMAQEREKALKINQQAFYARRDSAKLIDKYYSPIALYNFGYVNCDRMYKPEIPKTTITYKIANKSEKINYAKVVLIFKTIRAQIQSYYTVTNDKITKDNFNNIPVGMSVRFFVVSYQHGKIFAQLTEVMQTNENLNVTLAPDELNEDAFQALLFRID